MLATLTKFLATIKILQLCKVAGTVKVNEIHNFTKS